MSSHSDSRTKRFVGVMVATGLLAGTLAACSPAAPEKYTTEEVTDGRTSFIVVHNPKDGPTLSYSPDSGVKLIEQVIDGDTYAFKDMNGSGKIDVWEDWREKDADRAADLATQLTMEQIAGLMLFSSHERSPADGLTDAQKTYLADDNLRAILNAGPSDVEANVTWSNEVQAYAESLGTADKPYIPVNFSSDPRSSATNGGALHAEGAGISQWPSNLGMGAEANADTMRALGEAVAAEYRALGITTALSPQIDLATDPRWLRVSGTLGEDADLAAELAKAYVEGFQNSTTYVSTVIKHFPGDGMGEGGRESHTNAGKYAVYPGGDVDASLKPFEAALDAAAVMTSYSIALDAEGEAMFGARKGSAYDTDKVNILREEHDYNGIIMTDWGVTVGVNDPDAFIATGWGVEDLTVDERHFEVLKSGVDMFGGNNAVAPVLAAHELWQDAFEAGDLDVDADTRFRESAARILSMMFEPGLYENPYLDLAESEAIVGSADKVEAGNQAQLDSVVLVKNSDGTIVSATAEDWADKTVYIPSVNVKGVAGLFGPGTDRIGPSVSVEVAEQYFGTVLTDTEVLDAEGNVVGFEAPDLTNVDLVIAGLQSPDNGDNFSHVGQDKETGEWYPISLQYRPYTADGENVRQVSISGDILADGTQENRSYFGHTSRVRNEADLDAYERAVAAVAGTDIPVITILRANNPTIPAEFDAGSNAIVVGFGVSDEALLRVALGLHEPKGTLPIAFPLDMDAVEAQFEDVPKDTTPYVDADGNEYAFGYGLNWNGVIAR